MEYKNIIMHFSDVHFSNDYKNLVLKSMLEFLDDVKKNKPRYVVCSGDYFDRRIENDDKLWVESIRLLIEISRYCKNFIIIKGTHSHDHFSLSILKEIQKLLPSLHYYDTLTIDEIDGDKWLLIPEEYPENPVEYYKDIYNHKIDYIVGHGELDGAELHSGIDNRKLKGWKFNVNLLETTGCKWCMWGHIHKPQALSKNTYYAGSLSRLSFGEEEDKGYRIYSTENNLDTSFVTLNNNDKFITLSEKETEKILNDNTLLEELKKENIHIRFNGEKDSETFNSLKKILIDKEIAFKNEIKKDKIIEIENKILYENIKDKELMEQFQELIDDNLKNNSLTKKEKILLSSEKTFILLNELITNLQKEEK